MRQNAFLLQLEEDLKLIQTQWQLMDSKLEYDWYAFNYWVLNFLYHIDFEDISDCITEYNDKGIDCFVHYEDTKELYIIQNTYCSVNSSIRREHVSDFLVSPLSFLLNNKYARSPKLQEIFNNIKTDSEYTVYLYYYITKPKESISNDIQNLFTTSNYSSYEFEVVTKLISLDEIINIYEGKRFNEKILFEYSIKLLKKRLIDLRSEENDKTNNVNTAYFAMNVFEIYNMFIKSQKSKYNLFDRNIREYLGLKGKRGKTNSNIYKTLINPTERNRFFYYNNGITIICDKYISPNKNNQNLFTVKQPQIVNGCQTVNTIVNTINDLIEEHGEKEVIRNFKHCDILVKVYEVNEDNDSDKNIYENIVKYTNSQTGFSTRDFASKNAFFLRLQEDFLKRGFYLIVRQSDQHTYANNNDLFERNKMLASSKCNIFNIDITKPKDLFIDLDKLLKALMAFYFDGYTAFKKSIYLLKESSEKYYIDFSKKITDFFSINNMINIYLIYVKSGGLIQGRKERYQIPYYILDFFGRFVKTPEYEYKKANDKLNWLFDEKERFEEVYSKITEMVEDYAEKYMRNNSVDYSTMTKNREMDIELINDLIRDKEKEARRNNLQYFSEYIK